jgi:hypothetical protein
MRRRILIAASPVLLLLLVLAAARSVVAGGKARARKAVAARSGPQALAGVSHSLSVQAADLGGLLEVDAAASLGGVPMDRAYVWSVEVRRAGQVAWQRRYDGEPVAVPRGRPKAAHFVERLALPPGHYVAVVTLWEPDRVILDGAGNVMAPTPSLFATAEATIR